MTECEKVICKMYLEDMHDNCNENRLLLQMLEAEPCSDAISRQAAVNIASGFCHPANVADELAKLPSVNPQEPTGHWIESDSTDPCWWVCSICHRQVDIKENYCPNCGAKMESGGAE